MSSQDGHNADARRASLLTERESTGVVELTLIRELNERCLELMVQLARSDFTPAPEALVANRALWTGLDATARHRAASYPFLLLDINFASAAWWRWAANPQCLERKGAAVAHFPTKIAAELMRETTTLAWIIARSDQRLGTVLCGMAPAVARLFASFGTPDVERVATKHCRCLRLRYDDHPVFWRALLRVSGSRPIQPTSSLESPHSDTRQQRLF